MVFTKTDVHDGSAWTREQILGKMNHDRLHNQSKRGHHTRSYRADRDYPVQNRHERQLFQILLRPKPYLCSILPSIKAGGTKALPTLQAIASLIHLKKTSPSFARLALRKTKGFCRNRTKGISIGFV